MEATNLSRSCRTLDYPDIFYFEAAEGWLMLGNIEEAERELDSISEPLKAHWEVLHLRWRIHASVSQWTHCLVFARALTQQHPCSARSWIALAETFYAMGEVEKAYKIAAANTADFPESWNLLYDAACYACLIGKFDEAKAFFRLAMRVGDAKRIRSKAAQDPNLKALWRESARAPKKTKKS